MTYLHPVAAVPNNPDAKKYAGNNDTCSRPPTDLRGSSGIHVFIL